MFFSRKTEGKVILLIEVQSSILRGSVIWLRNGQPPHILFTEGRMIPYKPQVGSLYLIKVTMKGLSDTIDASLTRWSAFKSAKNEGYELMPTSIDEVHYVLSSPWVTSQARTLSVSFEKDTNITADRVSDILKKERTSLVTDDGKTLEIIEEKIFDVRLNGYSISNWAGKQAREIEISYAATVGGTDSTKRFRDAVKQVAKANKTHFHSSLLLQHVGLRMLKPDVDAYTLIHVHGELTDAVVTDHGACVFFCSFPMGIDTIIRKIASATKTDERTADSLLALYLGERLDEANIRSAEPVMNEMLVSWNADFDKLFRNTPLSGALPPYTIIYGRAHEEFFAIGYRKAHMGSKVEVMSIDEVAPHVVFESPADRMRIIGVYALAINSLEKHS